MAFNREDLITWNELAPSFQTIIRALQTEITHLNQSLNTMRIVPKISHFIYLFEKHRDSKHPHSNGVNHILRQPYTEYNIGDIAYDPSVSTRYYLECISAGMTAGDIPEQAYDPYISDTEYNNYNTLDKIKTKIAELYNLFEEHKVINLAHPYANKSLVRQRNTYYTVGTTVFDDTSTDITKCLEVIQAGTTAPDNNPVSIPDPILPNDLLDADQALGVLNDNLEAHIAESDPHASIRFLSRQPNTKYNVGDKVFIPGQKAQYYLECVGTTGPGKTSSGDLSITLP